jgi:hypothetical protein
LIEEFENAPQFVWWGIFCDVVIGMGSGQKLTFIGRGFDDSNAGRFQLVDATL